VGIEYPSFAKNAKDGPPGVWGWIGEDARSLDCVRLRLTSLGMTELRGGTSFAGRVRWLRRGRQDGGATRLTKMGLCLEIHRGL
jgi:hypothetical protein